MHSLHSRTADTPKSCLTPAHPFSGEAAAVWNKKCLWFPYELSILPTTFNCWQVLSTPMVRMKCLYLQKVKATCLFSQTLRGLSNCPSSVEMYVVHLADEPWQWKGWPRPIPGTVAHSSLLHQSGHQNIKEAYEKVLHSSPQWGFCWLSPSTQRLACGNLAESEKKCTGESCKVLYKFKYQKRTFFLFSSI